MQAYWEKLELTPSGLPALRGAPKYTQEVEIGSHGDVTVTFGESKRYRHGTITLTSQRVLWKDSKEQAAISLSLIDAVEASSSLNVFATAKAYLKLKGRPVSGPPEEEKSLQSGVIPAPPGLCMLTFHGRGRDQFLEKITNALKMQEWKPLEPRKQKTKEFTTSTAGISGIMRSVKQDHLSTEKTLQEAFSDLDALMTKAKELVSLAERCEILKGKNSGEERDEFHSMLHQMGIPSPVTKENAGSAYHVQLSRQLGDFLIKALERYGGMIMLVDVYCMFNRARGTEMISPDDLVLACELFVSLKLPLKLRRFSSGVMAVQGASHSDEALAQRILALIAEHGPITALELSQKLNMSMTLATQHLLTSEQMEYLCRDEVIEATRFYKNIFA